MTQLNIESGSTLFRLTNEFFTEAAGDGIFLVEFNVVMITVLVIIIL